MPTIPRPRAPWRSLSEWLILQSAEEVGVLTPNERRHVDKMLFGMSVATSAVAVRTAYSLAAHFHNVAIARGYVQPYSKVFVDTWRASKVRAKPLKVSGLGKPARGRLRPPAGAPVVAISMIAGSWFGLMTSSGLADYITGYGQNTDPV